MKEGDSIKAVWTDGLVVFGIFVREERGYIILKDEDGKENPCNKHGSVSFEIIKEGDSKKKA